MPGPTPKPAHLRQRRNRSATSAALPRGANDARAVPALPRRIKRFERWHPMVLAWWTAVWHSPMASEFLPVDVHGLYFAAELHQRWWTTHDATALVNLSREIRAQEARFGLSPIDRRRLQWEIEKGEQADDRTKTRRRSRDAQGNDPRDVLKVLT